MAPGGKPGAAGEKNAPVERSGSEAEREFVRAVELHRSDQLDQALRHYARAAALDPGHAMVWNNMGVVLRRQGRRLAAIACYRRATALKPDDPTHRSNLGNVLRDLGRLEEAVVESGRSVELAPDSAGALHNHGLILQDLGRHDDAIAAFDRAIALQPSGPNYQWDRALNLLMKGDLAAGFVAYEARWKLPQNPPPRLSTPEWRGESLAGQSVLLHAEQGFGDTIQFARYAPLVKAQGAGRVILVCQPALARLLSSVEGIDHVVAQGSQPPPFDLHAPLLSLPRLFGTTLATVPATVPYLRPPTGSGFDLERPPGTRLAVGLVWAGKPSHRNDQNRSCPLDRFLAFMGDPRIAFYSLQKGPRAADIVETGAAAILRDLSRHLEDFADTAHVIRQLDLVITVDTAVAHLAGALGRPVWVALPAAGDWRWIRGREDSPWYPTMRLFRQERLGVWEPVMARIAEELAGLISAEVRSQGAPDPRPAGAPRTKPTPSRAKPAGEASRGRREDIIEVPSAFRRADGAPRFVMPIPRVYLGDAGVGYLHRHETQFGGYEYPTRLFFDRHLEPGDLLIDVGAHWGLYALTAATRWPGEVKVLAIEPAPENVAELRHWIARNGLERDVLVIPGGAGAEEGNATFARNSTMGHGVARPGDKVPFGTFTAPIVTIDSLIERLPDLARRRTFLKIDVEGHEPEVMAGAHKLVRSGRVEAIVWERGRTYDREPDAGRLLAMMRELAELGYAHHRFPHETLGGPLIPYVPNHELVNVFSLGRSFLRKGAYARPPGPVPAPARPSSRALSPEERVHWTEMLMAAKATDGGLWSDPESLAEGADERARLAAPHIADGSEILDLGAGSMRLREHLAATVRYRPADLVLRDPDGVVVDLNADDFPAGRYDGVAMLAVLEHLHDPGAVLARARAASPRLLLSYALHEGGDTVPRRAAGIFNDFSRKDIERLLAATAWEIVAIENGSGFALFLCRGAPPKPGQDDGPVSEGASKSGRGWGRRLGLGRR